MIDNVNEFISLIAGQLPRVLLSIGLIVFLLTRVLGIWPVFGRRKAVLCEVLDFLHSKIGKIGKDYHIPAHLEEKLRLAPTNETVLNMLASDILAHCGMDSAGLTVRVEKNDPGKAGTYGGNVIVINSVRDMGYKEVIAVLIHECMHHYLKNKGIFADTRIKNELLTDIAALYLGFGEYMNRGYIMVGYIKRNEIRYLRKKISSIRLSLL